MSFDIYLNSLDYPGQSSGNLNVTFFPPITMQEPYEVALVGGNIVNSIPNVSPTLNNNTFRYSVDGGTTWHTVTLPTGTYQTGALQTELYNAMDANGDFTVTNGVKTYAISFVANLYLLRVQTVLAANAEVDFTTGLLYQLLGYQTASVLSGGADGATFTAENNALFTNASDVFYIQTNIVDGGINLGNNPMGGIVKTVESSGLGISIGLSDPSGDYPYFPVHNRILRGMTVTVYNNFGQVADFRGESASFGFRFRPRK